MSEQQMPARIWAEDTRDYGAWFDHPKDTCPVEYVRSDIAERMAEALEKTALVCSGDTVTKRGLIEALECARSALSAFKGGSAS